MSSYLNTPNVHFDVDKYTVSLLRFEDSVVKDECGIVWNTVGNPILKDDNIKIGTKSLYLDGESCIYTEEKESFNFGTEPFTLEAWVYPIEVKDDQYGGRAFPVISRWKHGISTLYLFQIGSSLTVTETDNAFITFFDNASLVTDRCIEVNKWSYIVCTRDSDNIVRIFWNGTLMAQGTFTKDYTDNVDYTMTIGATSNRNQFSHGYFSEIRISKGIARYIDTFNLNENSFGHRGINSHKVSEIVYRENDSSYLAILLQIKNDTIMDGKCHWNLPQGSINFTTENTKYGNALLFDGVSQYIQRSESITLGGQDFTIDFYGYATVNGTWNRFFTLWSSTNSSAVIALYCNSGNFVRLRGNSNNRVDSSTVSNLYGNLNHYAIVYQHKLSTLKCYVNGTLTNIISISLDRIVYDKMTLGYPLSSDETYYKGTIEEFRILDGVAQWLSNFSVPESQYKDNVSINYEIDEDKLKVLLHFNDTVLKDECNNVWLNQGTSLLSDTVARFDKSLYLNGSSYIKMQNSIELGGQDFTIDGWTYMDSSTSSWGMVFALYPDTTSNGTGRFFFGRNDTNNSFAIGLDGSSDSINFNPVSSLFHFAVVYNHNETKLKVYINGYCITTLNKTVNRLQRYLSLGASVNNGGNWYYKGYLDEFRILDGVALYKENFLPPSKQYGINYINVQNKSELNTVLLKSLD